MAFEPVLELAELCDEAVQHDENTLGGADGWLVLEEQEALSARHAHWVG